MTLSLEENIYRHEFGIKYGELVCKQAKSFLVNGKPLDMSGTEDFVLRLKESLEVLKMMENPSKG
jgi:hypothetical protein